MALDRYAKAVLAAIAAVALLAAGCYWHPVRITAAEPVDLYAPGPSDPAGRVWKWGETPLSINCRDGVVTHAFAFHDGRVYRIAIPADAQDVRVDLAKGVTPDAGELAIVRGRLAIGLTKQDVVRVWGRPSDAMSLTSRYGRSDTWYYGSTAVFFDDDEVSGF